MFLDVDVFFFLLSLFFQVNTNENKCRKIVDEFSSVTI